MRIALPMPQGPLHGPTRKAQAPNLVGCCVNAGVSFGGGHGVRVMMKRFAICTTHAARGSTEPAE